MGSSERHNMEPVNIKSEVKESKPQIERVILGTKEAEIVNTWTKELNERADGLIKFTKADVVNFLIRSHDSNMSDQEIRQISNENYNEAKWLEWALIKIKKSKSSSGVAVTIEDLEKFKSNLLGDSTKPRRNKRSVSIIMSGPDNVDKTEGEVGL